MCHLMDLMHDQHDLAFCGGNAGTTNNVVFVVMLRMNGPMELDV